jgi:hypothetical protein
MASCSITGCRQSSTCLVICSTTKALLWRTGYPHGVLVLIGFSGRLVLWIEKLLLKRNCRIDGRVREVALLQHTIPFLIANCSERDDGLKD